MRSEGPGGSISLRVSFWSQCLHLVGSHTPISPETDDTQLAILMELFHPYSYFTFSWVHQDHMDRKQASIDRRPTGGYKALGEMMTGSLMQESELCISQRGGACPDLRTCSSVQASMMWDAAGTAGPEVHGPVSAGVT